MGAPVKDLPSARNFIDEMVFSKLKEMGMPPSAVCDDSTLLRRVTIEQTYFPLVPRLPFVVGEPRAKRGLDDAAAAGASVDVLVDGLERLLGESDGCLDGHKMKVVQKDSVKRSSQRAHIRSRR